MDSWSFQDENLSKPRLCSEDINAERLGWNRRCRDIGCWDDSESGSCNIRVWMNMDKIRQGQEWMKTIKIFLGRASDAWRIRITVGDQSIGPQLLLSCTTLNFYSSVPHSSSSQLCHPQFLLKGITYKSYLIVPHLVFTQLYHKHFCWSVLHSLSTSVRYTLLL